MSKVHLLLLSLLLALPLTVEATPTKRVARLDPYLMRVARVMAQPETPSLDASKRAALERLDRVIALDLTYEPPSATVRVLGRPTPPSLARIGARRISRGEATDLVRVPLRALEALAALPGVIAVESIGRIERRLDVSVPLVGATALHERDPAVTGAGVVYGSIDDGIDIRHPTFRNADGTTRIEAFWDVCDESGDPPPGFEGFGGTLYTREDIDAALAGDDDRFPHVDFGGHGTMTAAIGAGSGNDGELVGMAPDAAIVVVAIFGLDERGTCENRNVGLIGSIDSLLPEATRFIEATAAARPFVVNMSLGDHLGPHDGTSLLDTELEALATAAPGRALIAAAGNEGDGGLHAGVLLPADGTPYEVDFAGSLFDGANLEIWYPADEQIEIRYRQGSACSEPIGPGVEHLSESYYIDNGSLGPDARNGDIVAFVEAWGDIQPEGDEGDCMAACDAFSARCDGDPLGDVGTCLDSCVHDWSADRVECVRTYQPPRGRGCNGTFRNCLPVRATVEVRAIGGREVRVDAYASASGTGLDAEGAPMTVGQPASSRGVIAAGGFVHRAQAGELPAQGTLGELTDYSSQGPMRDGRTKPEIAAPSELITSALAAGREPQFGVIVSEDGLWMTTSGGTSAASPGVAGAAALLLQVHPELDLTHVHEALALGAVVDDDTGAVPNDGWGWGKLQVAHSLDTLDTVRDDQDGDGFGDSASGGLDCDDTNPAIQPRAAEDRANGVDDDCDGEIDEPLPVIGFHARLAAVCDGELPDAGPDGGTGDAGPTDGDAGPGADGGPESDGGSTCDCHTPGRPSPENGAALATMFATVALTLLRRRRPAGR